MVLDGVRLAVWGVGANPVLASDPDLIFLQEVAPPHELAYLRCAERLARAAAAWDAAMGTPGAPAAQVTLTEELARYRRAAKLAPLAEAAYRALVQTGGAP